MIYNIGMTGGIGSGKNAAAALFEKQGFYTIDSDQVGRTVMAKGGSAYDEIISYFGNDILYPDGEIDRAALGNIVFKDSGKRKILENIVHPAILAEEKRMRGKLRGKDDKAVIITHAALIIEAGNAKKYDALIVITADTETRIKRITARDNISIEKAQAVIRAQLSDEERLKHADIIINNSGDEDYLEKEVKRAADLIKTINYGEKHSGR